MEDNKQDRAKFALLMGELGVAFRTEVTPETISVYWKNLNDRTMYQVENGIQDIIKSGDRFPAVSKIREISGSYTRIRRADVVPVLRIEEFSQEDLEAAARFREQFESSTPDEFFEKMLGG